MLVGEHLHTVDQKGRVVLPSSFRGQFRTELHTDSAPRCVVAKGQDGQLAIYPLPVWEKEAAEVMTRPRNAATRRFQRTFFGGADEQSLDGQGRLLLKPHLRQYGQIELGEDVMLVGVYDHIEIWNQPDFTHDRTRGQEEFMEEEPDSK